MKFRIRWNYYVLHKYVFNVVSTRKLVTGPSRTKGLRCTQFELSPWTIPSWVQWQNLCCGSVSASIRCGDATGVGTAPIAAPQLREDLAVCAKDIPVPHPGCETAQRAAGLSTPTWRSECCCLPPVSAFAKSLSISCWSKTSTCNPAARGGSVALRRVCS